MGSNPIRGAESGAVYALNGHGIVFRISRPSKRGNFDVLQAKR